MGLNDRYGVGSCRLFRGRGSEGHDGASGGTGTAGFMLEGRRSPGPVISVDYDIRARGLQAGEAVLHLLEAFRGMALPAGGFGDDAEGLAGAVG